MNKEINVLCMSNLEQDTAPEHYVILRTDAPWSDVCNTKVRSKFRKTGAVQSLLRDVEDCLQ